MKLTTPEAALTLTSPPSDVLVETRSKVTVAFASLSCTNGPSSGLDLPVYSVNGPYVSVYSPTPGVCHVELIFATGFTYSADVTYIWQEGACNDQYAAPTSASAKFAVNNPSDTCGDGG